MLTSECSEMSEYLVPPLEYLEVKVFGDRQNVLVLCPLLDSTNLKWVPSPSHGSVCL